MAVEETNLPSEQKESLLRGFRFRGSDEELHFQAPAQKFHRPPTLTIISFFLLLLATLSIFAAIFINLKAHAEHHTFRPLNASDFGKPTDSFTEWIDCGHTPSEARERGCVFDLMLSTWIHKSCYDNEMMNSYLLKGNHTYYYDEEMAHEMPEEEARRGEYKHLWTDGEFHLRHCIYLIDMQLRSYKTGRPIEVSIYKFGHTQHCINMTLWHDVGAFKTKLQALVGKCGFPRI